jgi:hypothetical protein
MAYLGDYDLGTTLYTKFTTVNASGVPTELSAPAMVFYQDNLVTAFPTVSGGLSCDASWNSYTGLNHAQMILTTSVTGIVTGSQYQLVVSTGTVSGVSLKGYVVGEFSIRKRSALMPTTANQKVVIDANGQVQANVTTYSTAIAANVTAASTNIGAVVTASNINIGAIVTAANTNIGAIVTASNINIGAVVTAANTNIGAIVTTFNTIAPAKVTSFSASGLAFMFLTDSTTNYAAAVSGSPVHEIGSNATIVAATTAVPANVTAASTNIGAVVTASNVNVGAVVTAVNTIVPARLTALGIDTGAIVTAFNTIAPANVTSISTVVPANVTSFSASGIGTLYTVNPAISYASATATSLVKALVTGVWDEVGANHTTIGSLGQELNSAGAAADPWATVLPGAYVTAQAGNIIGSRVDVSVGSRLATGATVASVSVLGTVAGVSALGTVASVSVLGTVAGVSALGTVASVSVLGTVSANIVQVASVSVTGFGTVASPWGP